MIPLIVLYGLIGVVYLGWFVDQAETYKTPFNSSDRRAMYFVAVLSSIGWIASIFIWVPRFRSWAKEKNDI